MGQSVSSAAYQNATLTRRANDSSISSSTFPWHSTQTCYNVTVYHGVAAGVVSVMAVNALLNAALLAGLILGLCGMSMTLMKLRMATGTSKERKKARAMANLKKHDTWMLCSLIIVSVGLGESFPFLIQNLIPGTGGNLWLPILISTLLLAIVGEILPQYIIPRRAISWGYHCRYMIWIMMGATAIISYPLAWCLDRFGGRKDDLALFTNEELGIVIEQHDRTERNGGNLGQDASRIMQGALKLDTRKIGSEIPSVPMLPRQDEDVEKADLTVVQGMIVKWSAVKAVRIDDRIDSAFIEKIRSWAYSRIPVFGSTGKEHSTDSFDASNWSEDTRVYGFFHVKSLIGLNVTNDETSSLVRDLPLYPLPIVREDMSVYELLNMFQTGMSRIAIIVPSGTGPTWTLTEKPDDEAMARMKAKAEGNHWSLRFLAAAEAVLENSEDEKCIIPGIQSPKPIGIMTYEDIIDMILQKTSLDEKDFYDRDSSSPPTKTRKVGDFPIDMTALATTHASSGCKDLQSPIVPVGSIKTMKNTLRRRNVTNEKTVCAADHAEKARSRPPGAMDGACESSSETRGDEIKVKKVREECNQSSYTANSQGGFHADGPTHSDHFDDNGNMLSPRDVAELAAAASSAHPKCSYDSSTMRNPTIRGRGSRLRSDELKQKLRHVSAAPNLPSVRRVTPFSRDSRYTSSLEKMGSVAELIMPEPSKIGGQDRYDSMLHLNASGLDVNKTLVAYLERSALDNTLEEKNHHAAEKSSDTISLQSCLDEEDGDGDGDEDLNRLYDAFPVSFTRRTSELSQQQSSSEVGKESNKPYTGFPMELLDKENQENRTPKYVSSTMPRAMGSDDFEIFEGKGKRSPSGREESFHDDRGLLPSQRKIPNQDEDSITGMRRTSLWF